MSARLRIQDLSGEDVDLLLSRSIDGDLSPEDQAELDLALASDPALRHRRDVLRGTVEDLKSLPTPEPPFALATRVNSQVGERIASLGSFWHRFGLYPPPGLVGAAVGVLAVAVVAINFLTPVKRAERTEKSTSVAVRAEHAPSSAAPAGEADGPVSVFFSDRKDEAAKAAASQPAPSLDAVAEKVAKKNDAPAAMKEVMKETKTTREATRAKNEDFEAQRVARLEASDAKDQRSTDESGIAKGRALNGARPGAGGYAPEQPVQAAAAAPAPPAPRIQEERQAAAKQEAGPTTRDDARMLARAKPAKPAEKSREADGFVAGKLGGVDAEPQRKVAETTTIATATGRASSPPAAQVESAPPAAPKPAALAVAEPRPADHDGDVSRAFVERERRAAGEAKRAKDSSGAKKASTVPTARLHLVSGAGWRLVTPSAPAPAGRYRLYLDLAGKVTAVRTADGGLVSTEVEHQMRGLVFERNGGIAGTDVEIEAK
jgi:hypothetical protein